MGRTFRRDDHHNSWGKSLRDKRQRGSERYREEYSDYNPPSKKRGGKKFNVNNVSDYYEEDIY